MINSHIYQSQQMQKTMISDNQATQISWPYYFSRLITYNTNTEIFMVLKLFSDFFLIKEFFYLQPDHLCFTHGITLFWDKFLRPAEAEEGGRKELQA